MANIYMTEKSALELKAQGLPVRKTSKGYCLSDEILLTEVNARLNKLLKRRRKNDYKRKRY